MVIDEAAPAVDSPVDSAAFRRVYDEWLDPIYGFVARRVEDRDAAEAVTARTFHRAVEALRMGSLHVEELPGFLLRVASSAVIDHARRLRKPLHQGVRASDLDDAGDAQAAAWLADAAATRAFAAAVDAISLRRATLRLDDDDLRAVLLRYLDGLDVDAVAAVLGCSRDDAGLRIRRALDAMAAELGRNAVNVA